MVNIDSLKYSSLKSLKSNKKFTKFSNLIIAPSHPLFACKELSSALSKYSKKIRYHKLVQRQVRCYDVPVICERKTDKSDRSS
jgi:hypothetical protein